MQLKKYTTIIKSKNNKFLKMEDDLISLNEKGDLFFLKWMSTSEK